MNEDPCVITINGDDYFYPCDKKDSIVIVDNHLVNTSSTAFTLYAEFPEQGNTSSGYPRIVCNSNQLAYIRQSYGSSTYQTITVNSAEFKSSHFTFDVLLLITLVGVGVCQLFRR